MVQVVSCKQNTPCQIGANEKTFQIALTYLPGPSIPMKPQ